MWPVEPTSAICTFVLARRFSILSSASSSTPSPSLPSSSLQGKESWDYGIISFLLAWKMDNHTVGNNTIFTPVESTLCSLTMFLFEIKKIWVHSSSESLNTDSPTLTSSFHHLRQHHQVPGNQRFQWQMPQCPAVHCLPWKWASSWQEFYRANQKTNKPHKQHRHLSSISWKSNLFFLN